MLMPVDFYLPSEPILWSIHINAGLMEEKESWGWGGGDIPQEKKWLFRYFTYLEGYFAFLPLVDDGYIWKV